MGERNQCTALALAARISASFPAKPLPSAFNLVNSGNPNSGDLDEEYIVQHYRGKSWTDITVDELSYAGMDSWAFSEEALAYFLPAFLTCFLEDQNAESFGLDHLTYWTDRLWPLGGFGYSRPQVQLVLEVFEWIHSWIGPDDLLDEYAEFLRYELADH